MAIRLSGLVIVAVLTAGTIGRGDVWDVQTQHDNTAASTNELVHGADQVHDLATLPGPAADEDWYRVVFKTRSSYEVLVDAASGDIVPLQVDRVLVNGSIFASSLPVELGFARTMRIHNPNPVDVTDKFIRVRSGGCTTTCGADDVYRIRYRETTGSVPRFNNIGTQVTVLILQNPGTETITGEATLWNAAGTALATAPFALAPRQSVTIPTAALPGAAGQSGSITVAHDGRYGVLTGKAVALEPATGFSFDSPLVVRP